MTPDQVFRATLSMLDRDRRRRLAAARARPQWPYGGAYIVPALLTAANSAGALAAAYMQQAQDEQQQKSATGLWFHMKLDGTESLGTVNDDGDPLTLGYGGTSLKTDDTAKRSTITGGTLNNTTTPLASFTIASATGLGQFTAGPTTTTVATATIGGELTLVLAAAVGTAWDTEGGYVVIDRGLGTEEVLAFRATSGATLQSLRNSAGGTTVLGIHAIGATVDFLYEVRCENEYLGYRSRSGTTLSVVYRGLWGTTVAAHADGTEVSSCSQLSTTSSVPNWRIDSLPQYLAAPDSTMALRCEVSQPGSTGRHSEIALQSSDNAAWTAAIAAGLDLVTYSAFSVYVPAGAFVCLPDAANATSTGIFRFQNSGTVEDLKITGTGFVGEVNPSDAPVFTPSPNYGADAWYRIMLMIRRGTGDAALSIYVAALGDPLPTEQVVRTAWTHSAVSNLRLRARTYTSGANNVRRARAFFRDWAIGNDAAAVWGATST